MESSTPNTLRHTFERWRRRLSLRRGLLRASKVMTAGAVGLGIFILTALVVPIPSGAFRSPSLIGAAWLVITLVLSLIALWLAPFSRRDAATIVDLRQDTGALFTTAEDVLCRLERGQPVSAAQRQCLNQASTQAPTLALADVAPMRPSPWWCAALVAVLLGGALPWIPFAVDPQHTLDQQRLNAAAPSAQQLNQQLDELGQHAQLDPATRKQLRRLARRIEEKSITPREALEEIGELKRRLRVERLKAREDASRAHKAARAAARELGRSSTTIKLAQKLAQGARTASTAQQREQAASEAAQAMRQLKQLQQQQRAEASARLASAARAAEAAGDMRLSESLQNAAQALASASTDPTQLDASAEDLRSALNASGRAADPQHLEELSSALEQVQSQLSGQSSSMARGTAGGQENQISPGPRQWSKGSGQPGRPGQPGTNSGAMPGTNHSDEETPGKASGNTHFDADRTTDAIPEEQMAEYKELYEELLMDDPNRIITAVKGQRGEDVGQDQVDVLRGGQQSPRNEQAQGVIKRLPVSYAEDARESINSEQVPPGYRDAVRGYFDQGR